MNRYVNWGLVCLSILLGSCGGSGGSDVGDQKDAAPTASAQALGLGVGGADNTFSIRSGSDVLLSGKDSNGVDDPILGFTWEQTDATGLAVELFERNRNSRLFTAPNVTTETQLQFRLTIEDADGRTATDTVNVNVLPVQDLNGFLLDPSVDETLYLVVAPQPGETVAADMPFTLNITTIAHWTDRDGRANSVTLQTDQLNGLLEEGYVGPADVIDPANPFFPWPIPLLDPDEVNVNFQGDERSRRLELELIETARLEFQVEFVPNGGGTCSVYLAGRDGGNFSAIAAAEVLSAGQDPGDFPADGAIASVDANIFNASLDEEMVRRSLGVESSLTAQNYYDCIDPAGNATTLNDWLRHTGFTDDSGAPVAGLDVAHALYVNNFDLGFGRNMFLREDEDGNVYSYVVNHPTLESMVKDQDEFATVVMEYSAAPTGNCGDGTFSDTQKIVKFYTYVPDETTGEMVRVNSMNFDGRGERGMPGVCTACHDGVINTTALSQTDLSAIAASEVDLSASFMPWNLEAFLFTEATESELVDPGYNADSVSQEDTARYSRENQLSEFRKLNEGTLATYVDDLKRFEEPIRLIHGWYGNSAALPPPLADAEARNDPDVPSPLEGVDREVLTTLPTDNFDADYIPPGWADQPELYRRVFARHCFLCHAQQDNLAINFDTYDEFINSELLVSYVYEQGLMPLSRLTLDRFWLPFDGGDESAAEFLRAHLIDEGIEVGGVPGDPVPSFSLSNQTVDTLGEVITLDGSASLFVDQYAWSVDSDCNSTPTVSGAAENSAAFTVDTSPCNYTVSLAVTNDRGTQVTSQEVNVDRAPVAVDFAASLAGYTPGDSLLSIDVLSEITEVGDGGLALVVNDPNPPYELAINNNVVNNGDGSVNFSFPALAGTSEIFEYKVEDVNGSVSANRGVVTVDIAPIVPAMQSPMNITASSATLEWTVPAGFVADNYRVFRDDPPVNGNFNEIGTTAGLSFVDNGLQTSSNYQYRVSAVLGLEESQVSGAVDVSTQSGVPTALTAGTRTTTTLQLSWSPGAGGTPDDYDVYRDTFTLRGNDVNSPFTDTGLTPNTTYSYEVLANFGAVESDRSTPLAITTRTAAPTDLVVSNQTTSSVRVSWQDNLNGGAPSYQVLNSGIPIGSSTTGNFVNLTGLNSDTNFNFTVRATGIDAIAVTSGPPADTSTSRTLASFDDDIVPEVVTPIGCVAGGCHVSQADVRPRLAVNTCLTDDSDLGDCDANMAGLTITLGQRQLILRWRADGTPD